MNSAMMPAAGRYESRQVSAEAFFAAIRAADAAGTLISWIGYQQNADIIEARTGVNVGVTRAPLTSIRSGDTLLCMRLPYRPNQASKGAKVSDNDFEYFEVKYH